MDINIHTMSDFVTYYGAVAQLLVVAGVSLTSCLLFPVVSMPALNGRNAVTYVDTEWTEYVLRGGIEFHNIECC